jgi:hypothetical protein
MSGVVREGPFQREMYALLCNAGRQTRVWRQQAGRLKVHGDNGPRVIHFAPAGAADLVGLVAPDGLFLEVECKSATGALREEQLAHGNFIARMGGVYVVVYGPRELVDMPRAIAAGLLAVDQAIANRRAAGLGVFHTGARVTTTRAPKVDARNVL